MVSQIQQFRKERDWLGLDAADLAKSIMIEAAELLEHYQWDNTTRQKGMEKVAKDQQAIAHELADIFIYLVDFCLENEIDLFQATLEKLKKNEEKYPVKK